MDEMRWDDDGWNLMKRHEILLCCVKGVLGVSGFVVEKACLCL
jgi:hypothetical protein